MRSNHHPQMIKLATLVRAAAAGEAAAARGLLFCTRAGLALVNAAFDLFECDALYELAGDVEREIGIGADGNSLTAEGDPMS